MANFIFYFPKNEDLWEAAAESQDPGDFNKFLKVFSDKLCQDSWRVTYIRLLGLEGKADGSVAVNRCNTEKKRAEIRSKHLKEQNKLIL